MKRWYVGVVLTLLMVVVALPVLAAPEGQSGGGVHVGPFTLNEGEYYAADLVVFGGPVLLMEDSVFDGDLTVFGPIEMEANASLDGQLVVTGSADVAGRIEGDLFSAGAAVLRDTARVAGDVSAVGTVEQEEGAVIEGELLPIDEGNWRFIWRMPGPFAVPRIDSPAVEISRTPRWVTMFLRLVRGVASVVVLSLLGLVIASLWPVQMDRVGRAMEEAPLPVYGVGLLTLILVALGAVLLTITICLSPFAVIALIITGIGILFGWVALGLVLGRRVLVGLLAQPAPKPAVSAVVGTALITLILAMARIVAPFHTLLLFLLVPPAAGAVLLTRFGTMPYATSGRAPVPPNPVPPRRTPPAPRMPPRAGEREVIKPRSPERSADDVPPPPPVVPAPEEESEP
ncbi:MAG: bactofilin family protein [Anaerolineae bacterium]